MPRPHRSKSKATTPKPGSAPSLPTVAPYPFNQSSGDLTLRTPDRVDFHVHSHILSQASPVFADMFSLPQPPSISRDEDAVRPIVDVIEDSRTLKTLLCLCYPIEKEKQDELEDIVPVLRAAMKYDMKWPISLLTTDILAIAPQNPLKVWAIASRCGLEVVAQKAASIILKKAKRSGQPPRSPPDSEEEEDAPLPRPIAPLPLLKTMLEEHGKEILHGISAADYFRLREYLRAGEKRAATKLLSPTVSPPLSDPTSAQPALLDGLILPFPPPDTILRCSDGPEFRVHAVTLLLHSPTLGERLRRAATDSSACPAPPQSAITTNDAQLISLEVDIDSATLSALLAVLYGGNTQLPSHLRLLSALLVAATKFGMVQVIEAAKGRWDSLATTSPLEAYFVAIEHGLTDYARSAARKVLEPPVAGVYVGAMESGTALTYYHLLEYYRACARTIDARMKARAASWSTDINTTGSTQRRPNYSGYSSSYCTSCLRNPTHVPNTYLSGLATKMDVDTPGTGCSFDVTLPALLRESSSVWPGCPAGVLCQPYVEVLMKISAELPQVLADAIAEVC